MAATFSLSNALQNQKRISEAVENSALLKRDRVEESPPGIPVGDQVLASLAEAADWIIRSNRMDQNLELEMRLGLISQPSRRWLHRGKLKRAHVVSEKQRSDSILNFKAGVDEYYAHQVKENLVGAGFVATTLPIQTLHCQERLRYQILSSEATTNGGRENPRIIMEMKERLYTQDVAMLAHDYDLRFGLALEQKINTSPSNFDPRAWEMQRVKKRTEYRHPRSAQQGNGASSSSPCPWRVDYTELLVRRRGTAGNAANINAGNNSNSSGTIDSKEFEIEVELDSRVARQWLQMAFDRGGALTASTAAPGQDRFINTTTWLRDELVAILEHISPCHVEEGIENFETPLYRQELDYSSTTFFRPMHMLNRIVRGESPAVARSSLYNDASSSSRGVSVPDFLGSMPINLYRRSYVNYVVDPISNQQATNGTAPQPVSSGLLSDQDTYFIAEKSDGVRYLLYTVSVPANPPQYPTPRVVAVLMDRSRTLFQFVGSDVLGQALGAGHVLDGEIVFHRDLKRSVFLIFDVLCWQERSLVGSSFAYRYNIISQQIIPTYAQNMRSIHPFPAPTSDYAANGFPEKERLLLLQGKHFYRLTEISLLLQRARSAGAHVAHGGERIYKDDTKCDLLPGSGFLFSRSHHPTDGIIFQPNGSYVFGKHYELLKWKWADLRSVDLAVDPQPNERPDGAITNQNLYLLCSGPDDTRVNCTKRGDVNVGLGVFDALRLMAELDYIRRLRQQSSGGLIAEVAYDLRFGQWRYIKMRVDKTDPNFIDSVLGVFTEQAEAISEAELEYSLLCATQDQAQDYDKHMMKMMEQLLIWQRRGRL
jgi:hypothetical protein